MKDTTNSTRPCMLIRYDKKEKEEKGARQRSSNADNEIFVESSNP